MKGRRPPVQREERIRPTPETLSKLRPDVIRELVENGRLRPEHLDAANEIRDTWLAFGKGMFPRPTEDGIKVERSSYTAPIDRLSKDELRIWWERYKPWANEMGIPTTLGVSRLQMAIDVVVDNYKPASMEHLRVALHRYAQIAGML